MDARREVGREVTWVTVFINCNNAFVPQLAEMLQRKKEGVQFQSDCEIGDLDDHLVWFDIAAQNIFQSDQIVHGNHLVFW